MVTNFKSTSILKPALFFTALALALLFVFGCKKLSVPATTTQDKLFFLGTSGDDVVYKIIKLHDGGYALTGTVLIMNKHIYLARFSASGNLLWEKHYDKDADEEGRDMIETADGSLWISGYTMQAIPGKWLMYLMHVDKNGNLLREWHFNQPTGVYNPDESADVLHNNSDGTFTLVGYPIVDNLFSRAYSGDHDHYVTVDTAGKIVGEKNHSYNIAPGAYSFVSRPLDATGKKMTFLIQGPETGTIGNYIFALGEFDKTFAQSPLDPQIFIRDTVRASYRYGVCVERTPDGGMVFSTYNPTKTAEGLTYIFKADKSGKLVWKQTYLDCVQALSVATNGRILLAGHTNNDQKLKATMLDADGNTIWDKKWDMSVNPETGPSTSFSTSTLCSALAEPGPGSVIAATVLSPSGRSSDIMFMKIDEKEI